MERFAVAPALPNRIHRLHELALDVWWSWSPVARQVFRRLDYPLWRYSAHNPVRMLMTIDSARLQAAAEDPDFVSAYDQAIAGLDEARASKATWWAQNGPALNGKVIAYFSAEFALHQSLPIYAGGLG